MDTDIWAFGYAFTVALGGVIGYVKAGSIPSLMAGLVFGGLALIGAYQTSQDPPQLLLISRGVRSIGRFDGLQVCSHVKDNAGRTDSNSEHCHVLQNTVQSLFATWSTRSTRASCQAVMPPTPFLFSK
ncbi:hypothetical protein MTO96_010521 [Rhipicephalus appendiculatus]